MTTETTNRGTYSPEDNKLRLYPEQRLDPDEYQQVKKAGFIWAAKQGCFVAPMWTPEREDVLREFCEEIEDEDMSLIDRAETRAERFEEYEEKRAGEAESAHASVSRLTDGIPFGQPILVGHHSEKRARKDAEKIDAGLRRAVRLWETSQYWRDRAASAIQHAKYKERPDVRARRIKGLEADLRRSMKSMKECEGIGPAWEKVLAMPEEEQMKRALYLANYHGYLYGTWSDLNTGKITPVEAAERQLAIIAKERARLNRWIQHVTNRLEYERAMLTESGGTVADRIKPEAGGACRCWASPGYGEGWAYIVKVNKVSVTILDRPSYAETPYKRTMPMDKLKGVMTAAQVQEAKDAGRVTELQDGTGFYIQDEVRRPMVKPEPENTELQAMRETLRHGVQTVTAPQLFPTPRGLAAQVVELAKLIDGDRVLEPSAGTGSLLSAINANVDCVAIEINSTLAESLRKQFPKVDVRCSDFLERNGDLGTFDAIIMNPPFTNAEDIRHIEHALHMLKPGGRLVAICANGPRQRERLMPQAETWIDLPAGSFQLAGTNVNVALLTMTAP